VSESSAHVGEATTTVSECNLEIAKPLASLVPGSPSRACAANQVLLATPCTSSQRVPVPLFLHLYLRFYTLNISASMRILVLGASGRVGKLVVKEALSRGKYSSLRKRPSMHPDTLRTRPQCNSTGTKPSRTLFYRFQGRSVVSSRRPTTKSCRYREGFYSRPS
jgi:hypothetical protein